MVRTSRVIKIDIVKGQNESLQNIILYEIHDVHMSMLSFSLMGITMIDNTTKHH